MLLTQLMTILLISFFFFFQAEDGIRDIGVTGVQTCALPILVIDHEILAEGYQVRGDPVHEQSGGEVEKEDSKAYGKEAHQPALLRVYILRGDLGGRQHSYRRYDRQQVSGIGDRQVLEPQDAALVEAGVFWGHRPVPEAVTAELADNVEDPDKYRHLDQDGEASAEGIDPLLLVDLRHLLPLALGIVLELGSDPIHVRFQILHRAH